MAADRVLVARRVREPKCNRLENGIARLMPVGIVNTLELVQIHEHHGKHPSMPSRLGDPMFQPIIEEHAVREPRQLIMQGGLARAFFLFERRSQLMIDEEALPDFALQYLIERRESFDGLVQVPGRGRMVVENLTNPRKRSAAYEYVLHPGTRREYRSSGLLDEAPYVLALRKHFGEDGPPRAILACPHEPAFFKFLQILGLRQPVLKSALRNLSLVQ